MLFLGTESAGKPVSYYVDLSGREEGIGTFPSKAFDLLQESAQEGSVQSLAGALHRNSGGDWGSPFPTTSSLIFESHNRFVISCRPG